MNEHIMNAMIATGFLIAFVIIVWAAPILIDRWTYRKRKDLFMDDPTATEDQLLFLTDEDWEIWNERWGGK